MSDVITPKIVIGLGFGDEGKGMAVAHEVENAISNGFDPVVVRFNGGPQAGHNVRVVRNGEVLHHRHSQFGSGTMLGAETYITEGMLVDLDALFWEGCHLNDILGVNVFESIVIDRRCQVLLPMYRRVNQELEYMRGESRHGSTGCGIGVARACAAAEPACKNAYGFVIRVGDIEFHPEKIRNHMATWWTWLRREYGIDGYHDCEPDAYELVKDLGRLMARGVRFANDVGDIVRGMAGKRTVIFEGSQGMLLDKRVGWFPHVTYGDMDAFEARRLCGDVRANVIGVTRSYQTRHGAGPMPTESTCDVSETDNVTSEWAGAFRTGLLDVPSLKRAAEATCVDEVAVSNLDRYPGAYVTAWHERRHIDGIDRYVPDGPYVVESDEERLIRRIEEACDAPVTVVGMGPTTDDWHDR